MVLSTALVAFASHTAQLAISNIVGRVAGQAITNRGNKKLPSHKPANTDNSQALVNVVRGNNRLLELQANNQKQLAEVYRERNDIEMTRIEMEKAIALAEHQDRQRALALKAQLVDLKAKELRLTERLAQQEQVFRAQESALYRELLRELKTQEIDVKLQEIQTQWDAIEKNWPSRLNRRDTEELLLKGRTEYPLLLLIAPPNISRSCPDSFQNNLPQELRNHLKAFIKTQYGDSTYPVELYADYFNRDIFDIDVKQLRHVLSPLPTVVIYCDITDREVYFHVGSWGWGNAEFAEVTSEPWNWRDEKNRLQKDEPDVDECLYQLRLEVIDMYKVLSSFLVDWYYLNSDRHYLPVLPAIKSDFPREDLVLQIELIEAVHQRNLACSAYDDAVQCLRLELFAQAVTHFQTALRLSADFSEAELYLGIALCGAERYAEAEQQLAAVLKQEPQNVFALNYYGLSLLHLKQLSAALTCFEQLVELNPDCADGWLHLSETLSALGRGKLATPYLDKAKKLPPCASPVASVAPETVIVPAGEFMMGDNNGDSDEKPIHKVTIAKPFALGKYQVTFEDYDKYCEATGTSKPSDSGWGRGKRPVIRVSWNDAQKYCQWLSQQTGEVYRLPTEAEWEYACRAGTTTKYWWGDEVGKNKANCDGCGSQWDNKQTAPVGSFKPNPFGLYDMHGNVWEWCQDGWHEDYKGAPTDGSAWEGGDGNRVLRGGSWYGGPNLLRSANRGRNSPDYSYFNLGFRVVRSSPSIL